MKEENFPNFIVKSLSKLREAEKEISKLEEENSKLKQKVKKLEEKSDKEVIRAMKLELLDKDSIDALKVVRTIGRGGQRLALKVLFFDGANNVEYKFL